MAKQTIDELQVIISAQNKELQKALREATGQLEGFEKGADKSSASLDKLTTAAKLAAVAGVAAAGAAAVGAIKAFANYEQLVGGVETLFKSSSGQLMQYAEGAYKTAGLSANRYMETVTSFSASLIQGLGGDTEKAVQYANMAVTDMSDNANKMGTNIGMIQDAYQGFAKDNFTMLDNLKLGYGGTAGEMARLVNDSGVLGDSFKATAENVSEIPFDKLVLAIHKTQEEMGIAGTTAKEASSTISGAWSSLKGAFENVLTGVEGSGKQLSETMIVMFNQLADKVPGIIARLVSGLFDAVKTAISDKFGEGAWDIFSTLAVAISAVVAAMTAWNIVTTIATTIQAIFNAVLAANPIGIVILAIAALVAGLIYFFTQTETGRKIFETVMNAIKDGAKAAVDFVVDKFNAITGFFEGLWQGIKDIFNGFVDFVKNNWFIILLAVFTGGLALIVGAVVRNWDEIVAFTRKTIDSVINFFKELPGNIKQAAQNAWNGVVAVWSGVGSWFGGKINEIVSFFNQLPGRVKDVFWSVVNAIKSIDWSGIGRDIIMGIGNGIAGMGGWLADKAKAAVGNAKDQLKSFLGIHSPSRMFKEEIGKMIGLGTAEGITDSAKYIASATQSMGDNLIHSINNMPMPDASGILSGINGRQVPVNVNIDGERFLSFVIEGVNGRSFLSNSAVVDF